MKACLDACVLFPTVMREMLLETAEEGVFEPIWSERILEEWARATRRLPEGSEAVARAEIIAMKARWPEAMVPADDIAATPSPVLPDPNDEHVLSAALAGGADTLITSNRADFPNRILAPCGVLPRDPDGFLVEIHQTQRELSGAAARVIERAEAKSGRPQSLRSLLKRAGLPRLGKALG
ncbi:MAG: PIN domain-containing protein [Pseudomonadota bacterium]